MPIKVTVEKALQIPNAQFIDTRTPKEFKEDHLPNAVNIPILSNEERAVVGTLYKQVSKETAIEKGIEFFSEKMPHFMKEISKYKDKTLIIHCWRGGMRSRTVTALLESLNYNVFQLEGGYKAYRAFLREKIENYNLKARIVLLCGMTGTGKTELLQQFKNSVDLEGLAQHRGSLYGGIGLNPVNQKRFENLLWQKLETLKNEKYIIVEGESKRIGNCIIPAFFWKSMKKGIIVEVKRTIEKRANAIIKEYLKNTKNIEEIKKVTMSLQRNISKKDKENVVKLLDKKQYQQAVIILLEKYYDILYTHTLKDTRYGYRVDNEDVMGAKKRLVEYLKNKK